VASLRKSTGTTSTSLFTPLKTVKLVLNQASCKDDLSWLEKTVETLPEGKTLGESLALLTKDAIDEIIVSLSSKDRQVLDLMTNFERTAVEQILELPTV